MSDVWKVWGSPTDPIKIGTRQEVRLFVEEHPEGGDLYIEGPQGQEEMYEDGRWVPAR